MQVSQFIYSNLSSRIYCFILCLLVLGMAPAIAQSSPLQSKQAADNKGLVNTNALETVRNMLGQKIILDFRYFCHDNTASEPCRVPMTDIPDALLTVLSTHNIGGVILFSQNIVNTKQLVTLNYTMQQHMLENARPPLFIAVDQEGGRVARLPSSILPPFSGNMAIGASFHKHGTAFAENVADHIGQTLLPLGINTNFSPSVDVNSEPKNPVINVRSFSEDPQQVATLGESYVSAMQKTGVLSVLKHFPGHGDTRIDSHSGLPKVAHSRAEAMSGDLLPFASIINSSSPPAMVMSAHIQYPSLDNTMVVNKNGKQQIVPATLSKRILTDLLRTQLGYQGLVVTDALDMAGIAQFFSPEDAMLRAYEAGADIALMPFTIRNQQDIKRFEYMLNSVAVKLLNNADMVAMFNTSYRRILNEKQRYQLHKFTSKPKTWWLDEGIENTNAHGVNSLVSKGNQLEKALSMSSVTALYGEHLLPVLGTKLLALMPDAARCLAFESAITKALATESMSRGDIQFACLPLTALPSEKLAKRLIRQSDALIVGDITPLHASYELGGLDDAEALSKRASQTQVHTLTKMLMQYAKSKDKQVIFVPLRMPYIAKEMRPFSDTAIATFSYVINVENKEGALPMVTSETFETLAQVLFGQLKTQGRTPVSINVRSKE